MEINLIFHLFLSNNIKDKAIDNDITVNIKTRMKRTGNRAITASNTKSLLLIMVLIILASFSHIAEIKSKPLLMKSETEKTDSQLTSLLKRKVSASASNTNTNTNSKSNNNHDSIILLTLNKREQIVFNNDSRSNSRSNSNSVKILKLYGSEIKSLLNTNIRTNSNNSSDGHNSNYYLNFHLFPSNSNTDFCDLYFQTYITNNDKNSNKSIEESVINNTLKPLYTSNNIGDDILSLLITEDYYNSVFYMKVYPSNSKCSCLFSADIVKESLIEVNLNNKTTNSICEDGNPENISTCYIPVHRNSGISLDLSDGFSRNLSIKLIGDNSNNVDNSYKDSIYSSFNNGLDLIVKVKNSNYLLEPNYYNSVKLYSRLLITTSPYNSSNDNSNSSVVFNKTIPLSNVTYIVKDNSILVSINKEFLNYNCNEVNYHCYIKLLLLDSSYLLMNNVEYSDTHLSYDLEISVNKKIDLNYINSNYWVLDYSNDDSNDSSIRELILSNYTCGFGKYGSCFTLLESDNDFDFIINSDNISFNKNGNNDDDYEKEETIIGLYYLDLSRDSFSVCNNINNINDCYYYININTFSPITNLINSNTNINNKAIKATLIVYDSTSSNISSTPLSLNSTNRIKYQINNNSDKLKTYIIISLVSTYISSYSENNRNSITYFDNNISTNNNSYNNNNKHLIKYSINFSLNNSNTADSDKHYNSILSKTQDILFPNIEYSLSLFSYEVKYFIIANYYNWLSDYGFPSLKFLVDYDNEDNEDNDDNDDNDTTATSSILFYKCLGKTSCVYISDEYTSSKDLYLNDNVSYCGVSNSNECFIGIRVKCNTTSTDANTNNNNNDKCSINIKYTYTIKSSNDENENNNESESSRNDYNILPIKPTSTKNNIPLFSPIKSYLPLTNTLSLFLPCTYVPNNTILLISLENINSDIDLYMHNDYYIYKYYETNKLLNMSSENTGINSEHMILVKEDKICIDTITEFAFLDNRNNKAIDDDNSNKGVYISIKGEAYSKFILTVSLFSNSSNGNEGEFYFNKNDFLFNRRVMVLGNSVDYYNWNIREDSGTFIYELYHFDLLLFLFNDGSGGDSNEEEYLILQSTKFYYYSNPNSNNNNDSHDNSNNDVIVCYANEDILNLTNEFCNSSISTSFSKSSNSINNYNSNSISLLNKITKLDMLSNSISKIDLIINNNNNDNTNINNNTSNYQVASLLFLTTNSNNNATSTISFNAINLDISNTYYLPYYYSSLNINYLIKIDLLSTYHSKANISTNTNMSFITNTKTNNLLKNIANNKLSYRIYIANEVIYDRKTTENYNRESFSLLKDKQCSHSSNCEDKVRINENENKDVVYLLFSFDYSGITGYKYNSISSSSLFYNYASFVFYYDSDDDGFIDYYNMISFIELDDDVNEEINNEGVKKYYYYCYDNNRIVVNCISDILKITSISNIYSNTNIDVNTDFTNIAIFNDIFYSKNQNREEIKYDNSINSYQIEVNNHSNSSNNNKNNCVGLLTIEVKNDLNYNDISLLYNLSYKENNKNTIIDIKHNDNPTKTNTEIELLSATSNVILNSREHKCYVFSDSLENMGFGFDYKNKTSNDSFHYDYNNNINPDNIGNEIEMIYSYSSYYYIVISELIGDIRVLNKTIIEKNSNNSYTSNDNNSDSFYYNLFNVTDLNIQSTTESIFINELILDYFNTYSNMTNNNTLTRNTIPYFCLSTDTSSSSFKIKISKNYNRKETDQILYNLEDEKKILVTDISDINEDKDNKDSKDNDSITVGYNYTHVFDYQVKGVDFGNTYNEILLLLDFEYFTKIEIKVIKVNGDCSSDQGVKFLLFPGSFFTYDYSSNSNSNSNSNGNGNNNNLFNYLSNTLVSSNKTTTADLSVMNKSFNTVVRINNEDINNSNAYLTDTSLSLKTRTVITCLESPCRFSIQQVLVNNNPLKTIINTINLAINNEKTVFSSILSNDFFEKNNNRDKYAEYLHSLYKQYLTQNENDSGSNYFNYSISMFKNNNKDSAVNGVVKYSSFTISIKIKCLSSTSNNTNNANNNYGYCRIPYFHVVKYNSIGDSVVVYTNNNNVNNNTTTNTTNSSYILDNFISSNDRIISFAVEGVEYNSELVLFSYSKHNSINIKHLFTVLIYDNNYSYSSNLFELVNKYKTTVTDIKLDSNSHDKNYLLTTNILINNSYFSSITPTDFSRNLTLQKNFCFVKTSSSQDCQIKENKIVMLQFINRKVKASQLLSYYNSNSSNGGGEGNITLTYNFFPIIGKKIISAVEVKLIPYFENISEINTNKNFNDSAISMLFSDYYGAIGIDDSILSNYYNNNTNSTNSSQSQSDSSNDSIGSNEPFIITPLYFEINLYDLLLKLKLNFEIYTQISRNRMVNPYYIYNKVFENDCYYYVAIYVTYTDITNKNNDSMNLNLNKQSGFNTDEGASGYTQLVYSGIKNSCFGEECYEWFDELNLESGLYHKISISKNIRGFDYNLLYSEFELYGKIKYNDNSGTSNKNCSISSSNDNDSSDNNSKVDLYLRNTTYFPYLLKVYNDDYSSNSSNSESYSQVLLLDLVLNNEDLVKNLSTNYSGINYNEDINNQIEMREVTIELLSVNSDKLILEEQTNNKNKSDNIKRIIDNTSFSYHSIYNSNNKNNNISVSLNKRDSRKIILIDIEKYSNTNNSNNRELYLGFLIKINYSGDSNSNNTNNSSNSSNNNQSTFKCAYSINCEYDYDYNHSDFFSCDQQINDMLLVKSEYVMMNRSNKAELIDFYNGSNVMSNKNSDNTIIEIKSLNDVVMSNPKLEDSYIAAHRTLPLILSQTITSNNNNTSSNDINSNNKIDWLEFDTKQNYLNYYYMITDSLDQININNLFYIEKIFYNSHNTSNTTNSSNTNNNYYDLFLHQNTLYTKNQSTYLKLVSQYNEKQINIIQITQQTKANDNTNTANIPSLMQYHKIYFHLTTKIINLKGNSSLISDILDNNKTLITIILISSLSIIVIVTVFIICYNREKIRNCLGKIKKSEKPKFELSVEVHNNENVATIADNNNIKKLSGISVDLKNNNNCNNNSGINSNNTNSNDLYSSIQNYTNFSNSIANNNSGVVFSSETKGTYDDKEVKNNSNNKRIKLNKGVLINKDTITSDLEMGEFKEDKNMDK